SALGARRLNAPICMHICLEIQREATARPGGRPRRAHPYQQNAGNRCAKRRSRRSRSTVRVKVSCSHRAQLCALSAPAAALFGTSALLAVVVRVSVVVGTLTGPLGRPSAARLAVVPAAAGSGAHLPPAVGQREAD